MSIKSTQDISRKDAEIKLCSALGMFLSNVKTMIDKTIEMILDYFCDEEFEQYCGLSRFDNYNIEKEEK